LARRLEARMRPGQPTLFPYESPEEIWNEHRESTRGRDLDITGLSYAMLGTAGPQQWPIPEGAAAGCARLYEAGTFATADGRAEFSAIPWRPLAEPTDARHPFTLITGRLRDQWHGMTRTGTLGRLFGHVPEPSVGLHPQDLARLGLAEGDLAHVTSRRGSIVVPVQGLAELAPGQAWLAMHWGSEVLSGRANDGRPLAGVNALTLPVSCPISRQPELKGAAVRIVKAELPWALLAMAWVPADRALRIRAGLAELMPAFGFAACVPFGRERCGVMLRAAADEPPPDEVLARIETLLELDRPDTLRYADRKRHQRRALRLDRAGADSRLVAVMLAGDTRSEAWLAALLREELPAQAYGRLLLRPDARAPVAISPRGAQVCTCFDVGEDAITAALAGCEGSDEARLAALQERLRCGTNCGSCIPALRRLVRAMPPQRAAARAG
ncbi:MAG TPA: molybdopterin dinucleotide binding domain-containing protein, partial [Quisquiliibacterium sp.]|nr:molybdopterin dinucleotide binding domain-containing protein [Quisquiliibacterium sp.]